MQSANLYITNFCNQNCPFCFARKEMDNPAIIREMPYGEFEKLALRLKKQAGIRVIKLLGGEPTLHSRFRDIMRFSLAHFDRVQIFTNAIIPPPNLDFLLHTEPDRIGYTFNLSTPAFTGGKLRELVARNVSLLQSVSRSTISLTVLPTTDPAKLGSLFPEQIVQGADTLRIGLANPMADHINAYGPAAFSNVGHVVTGIMERFRKIRKDISFFLNCGFTRCMFTDREYDYVKKRVAGNRLYFSCYGKDGSIEVNADLDMFHCFSLSEKTKEPIRNAPLKTAQGKIMMKRLAYRAALVLEKCRKCPFYGIGEEQCMGPCIALLMNAKINSRTC